MATALAGSLRAASARLRLESAPENETLPEPDGNTPSSSCNLLYDEPAGVGEGSGSLSGEGEASLSGEGEGEGEASLHSNGESQQRCG